MWKDVSLRRFRPSVVDPGEFIEMTQDPSTGCEQVCVGWGKEDV
ncbi:hypothetical protein L917_00278 [Phytophthora nicotianae]|uniref:Uncharacterized protein n=1 Tax=Phytophthora nicotianae TaxID=4792 RepID=W2P743_PHYNI|nr:hypothetical protein L917_00278 [Phytophthora nicotianae]ETM56782.1 hypothetical protein L914_00297 [Phytophthora nicotianae]